MTDVHLDERIAALPPERRALFERLLAQSARPVKYELSFTQRGLWFIERLMPVSPLYTTAWRCQIRGPLDLAALGRALNGVIARHDTLRTRFSTEAGHAVQIVLPRREISMNVDDLRGLAETDREAAVTRLAAADINVGFDLERDPLLRTRIVRLADDQHVLLLYLHHIVFDAASTEILIRELCELYEADIEARPSSLAPPSLQYGDYVAWQRERLRGEHLEKLVRYWQRTLDGAPGILDLPADRLRPAVPTFGGAVHNMVLPARSTAAMGRLAAAQRCTLFMAYLAVFQAMLARYTGRSDICVGTPAANRGRREFASLVGFCVNVVVMRTDCSGDPSFRQLLDRVRAVCLGAYDHEELPFEQLVETLAPQRSLSHNPLFQAACVLDPAPCAAGRIGPARIESMRGVHPGLAKFDLFFAGVMQGEGIETEIDYSTDLFDRATIERISRHFQRLWDAAAAEPDRPISQLAMLDDDELSILDPGALPVPALAVHDVVARHAESSADAIALVSAGVEVTYQALDRAARQLADRIAAVDVRSGALVGICLDLSVDLIAAVLAVTRAGGKALLLPPGSAAQTAALAEQRGITVLVCPKELESGLARTAPPGLATIVPEPLGMPVRSHDQLDAAPGDGRPEPRGLAEPGTVLTASSLSQMAAGSAETFGLTGADRVTAVGAGHPWLATMIFGALYAGAACRLPGPGSDPDGPPLSWRPTVLFATSRQLAGVPDEALGCLRLLVTDPARLRPFRAALPAAVMHAHAWGGYVVAAGSGSADGRHAAALTPLPGLSVLLLDGSLRLIPAGMPGDVYLAGPQVDAQAAAGPGPAGDLLASPRGGRWLRRTQDVMRRRADGLLEYLCRRDALIEADGGLVIPRVIEDTAIECPRVADAVVVRDPDGARFGLYVTVAGDERCDTREVQAFLAERLPQYMIPAEVVEAEAIVTRPDGTAEVSTPGGWNGAAGADKPAYTPPRTALERILVSVWSDLLEVDRVGVDDNFFDLGGHSLLAIKLLSTLIEVFGVEFPISVLFGASTPATLGAQLTDALGGPDATARLAESVEAILGMSDEEVQQRLDEMPSQ